MGYVRHNAIVATTWQEESADALMAYAASDPLDAAACAANGSQPVSGKPSRARRVAAVNRARADVYASNGDTITNIPFPDDPRQQRIYEASYGHWRDHYWRMERLGAELAQVYGASQ